jgi:hypothetical protein
MGFDLKARRPREKALATFNCNPLWWGPLWQFVIEETGHLLPEDVAFSGYFNEGTYVRATWARTIANRLEAALASGRAARYARRRRHRYFDEEGVSDFRDFSRSSGGFWIR